MSLVRLLFSILFLKAKPQDMPFDYSSMIRIVLIYLVSGVFVLSKTVEVDVAVYSMVLDIVVLAAFTGGCLILLKLKPRLVQTFAALFGTGVLFHLLAWPIIEQLSMPTLSDSEKSTLSLLFLLLLSWQILVNAHIYRNALSVNMTKAVVLAIAYWLMSMTLSQIIIPAS